MIPLSDYREFWETVAGNVEEITGVIPVTVDENVAQKIKALPLGSVTLFWIAPSATGSGNNVDVYRERNQCVVFVMEKYDPARKDSLAVLESTQPVIEKVKDYIRAHSSNTCSAWILDGMRIDTIPETKFFANFAGWSVGFTIVCLS